VAVWRDHAAGGGIAGGAWEGGEREGELQGVPHRKEAERGNGSQRDGNARRWPDSRGFAPPRAWGGCGLALGEKLAIS
jgi:hypothetical protein